MEERIEYKNVAFITLGCKVNQYETDVMKQSFLDKGYSVSDFEINKPFDIFIVNSCSVTNLSTRKTRNFLNRARKINQKAIIVLAGCYAQELKETEDNSNIKISADVIIGNEEKKDIVKYVEEYYKSQEKNKSIKIENNKIYKISKIDQVNKFTDMNNYSKYDKIRQSIKIQDGCDNFCSFCIIPYLRGRVRSRNKEEILKEIKYLTIKGVKEIVLVGIEIASYGKENKYEYSLIDLIEDISKLNSNIRIRLGSIEPRWLTKDNIIRLSKIPNLCNHFHISVQSLNNKVLKDMNRKYTKEDVFESVELIRKYIKEATFTCDIIVGFPKETNEEFIQTMEGIEKIQFLHVHTFKYSKRIKTRAAVMDGQVDDVIKQQRSKELIELSNKISDKVKKEYIGKFKEVLIEEYSNGYLEGYTSNYLKVKVKGDEKLWGTYQKVELISVEKDIILGKI